jgi:hypothetical protein
LAKVRMGAASMVFSGLSPAKKLPNVNIRQFGLKIV